MTTRPPGGDATDAGPVCGNGHCEPGETCLVCAADCGCKPGQTCLADGTCCARACEGKACGDDGCGGSCGTCTGGAVCNGDAQCVCQPKAYKDCHDGDLYWFDSCGAPTELAASCPLGCSGGVCLGCTASCSGKECGDDGCGGSCGTCTAGAACSATGQCVCQTHAYQDCYEGDVYWFDGCGHPEGVAIACGAQGCSGGACAGCVPQCQGKVCGDDGCGGQCGTCRPGEDCVGGHCQCVPSCEGAQCGDDGCGGSCGSCSGGKVCDGGVCKCEPKASKKCVGNAVYWFDSCGNQGAKVVDCPYGCAAGVCQGCTPQCAGAQCGGDGCGGSCGSCGPDEVCQDGQCHCVPNCEGTQCGDDGCGGSCGACSGGKVCDGGVCKCEPNASKKCVGNAVYWFDSCGNQGAKVTQCPYGCSAGVCQGCTPQCAGAQCGEDGCGGSCGTCAGGKVCDGGVCKCQPNASKKCVGDAVYWFDSCGNQGAKAQDCPFGCSGGTCLACQPQCDGAECGDDGCGGSCGTCAPGTTCKNGTCVAQASCAGYCGDAAPSGCLCTDDCAVYAACCPDVCNACSTLALCSACDPDYCADRECGPDTCGGVCGYCPPEERCVNGHCQCVPLCPKGAECGDDGCGGTCGTCPEGMICSDHQCVPGPAGCSALQAKGCGGCACEDTVCTVDPYCCQTEWDAQCAQECQEALCTQTWDGSSECGWSACGEPCQTCASGQYCYGVYCHDCKGDPDDPGDDSCAPGCGSCETGYYCGSDYTCHKKQPPKCLGKHCGFGGVCGTCPTGQFCWEDMCVESFAWGDPAGAPGVGCCLGSVVMWSDGDEWKQVDCHAAGCGWHPSLGRYVCGGPLPEDPSGVHPRACGSPDCSPQCAGKACGPDGCGGSCGTCPPGNRCEDGQCVAWAGCGDGVCFGSENCANCPQDCHCAASTPHCTADGTCVECVSASDCVDALSLYTPALNAACVNHQCTCTQLTCDEVSVECGNGFPDGCGDLLDCGECMQFPNSECDYGKCVCTPSTCPALDADCGLVDDGCGGTLDCGQCPAGQSCVDNQCLTSGWHVEPVAKARWLSRPRYTPLGDVLIAYADDATLDIYVARRTGGTWQSEAVYDQGQGIGTFGSSHVAMMLDSTDQPLLFFQQSEYVGPSSGWKYWAAAAWKHDSAWSIAQLVAPKVADKWFANGLGAAPTPTGTPLAFVGTVNSGLALYAGPSLSSPLGASAGFSKLGNTGISNPVGVDAAPTANGVAACATDASTKALWVVQSDGTTLDAHQVDDNLGVDFDGDCAIVADGAEIYIAYEKVVAPNTELWVAVGSGTSWAKFQVATIANQTAGFGIKGLAMARDAQGVIYLAMGHADGSLMLYQLAQGAWTDQVLAPSGFRPRLAIDPHGHLAAAYRDGSTLVYRWWLP